MKTKRNCFQTGLVITLALALNPIAQALDVPARPAGRTNAPIPWDQIGAKAGTDYHGDGLAVTPATDGARLHCVFQRLDGEATPEGLWLTSTVTNTLPDRFQVKAAAVGRTDAKIAADLSTAGEVSIHGQNVSFVRHGLTEEYSVSLDGVRQDFVVTEKPLGAGELRVRLDVDGAKVAQTAYGAQLILNQSGRKIAYSRLRVTDATGKELPARVEAGTELAVVVNDARAIYPVRIDPTFSDANWISLGGIPGADGTVSAAVVDGSGNLYIGGSFGVVGNIIANGIARWNGSSWSALGSGILGVGFDDFGPEVSALAVSGGTLYVGGVFTMAGGVAATNIAQWNGSSWSALGSGLNYGVYALAASGGTLYAGGEFGIAQWNGSSWSTLGSGLNGLTGGEVYALAVSGSMLYAGGSFSTAGGVTANYIAQWNGSSWSTLGSGMNNWVFALAVSGSTLYAGGSFTTAGGVTANYIAQWNGSSWSMLDSGMNGGDGFGPRVSALAVSGSTLYAGGDFSTAGGIAATNIAQWNGSSWSALGSGMNYDVSALVVSGSTLYAGGSFSTAGGVAANGIVQWNGSSWSVLGSGISGITSPYGPDVYALAVSGSTLYAGGSFSMAGGVTANYIAQWNGSSWSALGSGMSGGDGNGTEVYALAVSGSTLYAGGDFTMVGGVSANYIAQWNGSSWSALGSGMDYEVEALAVSGGILYAGGYFDTAGGVGANYIAQWNGSSWSALGSGMSGGDGFGTYVSALAVSGDILYAGGDFSTAGGVGANYIAQWNGSSWSALGSGMNDDVTALAVSGSTLYAGGTFSTAGGVGANYIAQWNGSSWSALGSGMNDDVIALAVSGDILYAGGYFDTAGGVEATYIAQWNGSSWSALGSGMNDDVFALAVSGSTLYVGGDFSTAGTTVSASVAEALLSSPFVIVTTNGNFGFANQQFQFTLIGPTGSNAVISASTNLQNWLPLATNPLVGGLLTFTDTLATNYPSRFYRVTLQP